MDNEKALEIAGSVIHKIINYNWLPKETNDALKKVLSLASQKINQDKQIIQVNHEELMSHIKKEYGRNK